VLRDLVANWDHRDEIVVTCWREDVAALIRDAGVEVDLIPARSTAHALLTLSLDRSLVGRHRPDVVWSQALRVPFDGPQVLHLRDIGVFDRTHSSTPRELVRRAQIKRDMRRADCIVVNSSAMADAVRASSRRPTDLPLEVVPNGLELAEFLAVTATDPTRGREMRILLPQSDLPHKRSHLAATVLHQVMGVLPERFTAARLVIPGGSPHLALRGALAERGLTDRADFRGFVDRAAMAALYAACDVVLITSATESFCNPAIEAAAAGRWLVAPPLPVLSETGGPMSLIARSANADDLADGVVRVAEFSEDWFLREQARSHASRFTAVASAGALRSVFDGIR
jgi:hypothetical protein